MIPIPRNFLDATGVVTHSRQVFDNQEDKVLSATGDKIGDISQSIIQYAGSKGGKAALDVPSDSSLRADFLSNYVSLQALHKASSSGNTEVPGALPREDISPAEPLLTSAASGAISLSSDISAITRTLPELDLARWGGSAMLFPIVGMTTSFNALQGAIGAYQAKEQYEKMDDIGATSQKGDAALDFISSLALSAGGASFLAYRPLSMASTITNVNISSLKSSSLLGRATFMMGSIGSALFGAVYACVSMVYARKLFRLNAFSNKFAEKSSDMKEQISFLTEKRLKSKSSSETLDKLLKSHTQDELRQKMQKKALKSVESSSKALLKEAHSLGVDAKGLVKEEALKYAEKIFESLEKEPTIKKRLLERMGLGGKLEAQDLSVQELIGLELMTADRNEKKEVKLTDCIGSSATALVKNALQTKLVERLGSSDPFVKKAAEKEAEELLSEVKKGMSHNKKVGWALALSSFIGLVVTVCGFLPLSGVAFVSYVIGSLLCFTTMFLVDWLSLKEAQKDNGSAVGKNDRMLLHANTALATICLASVIVIGSIFSMGIPAIATAAAIGALWLGNNIRAYYKLQNKEIAFKKAHPSLHDVKGLLSSETNQSSEVPDSIKMIIKRLAVHEKKAIKAFLLGSQQDIRSLSDQDRQLDHHHDFGREFALKSPKDEAVLRSAEKCWEKSRSIPMLGLIERILDPSCEEMDVKKYIEELNETDRNVLFQHVYNKKARKASSKAFDKASVQDVSCAVSSVLASQKAYKAQIEKEALSLQLHKLQDILPSSSK